MFHTRSKECTVFFLHRIYLEVERHQDGFVSFKNYSLVWMIPL